MRNGTRLGRISPCGKSHLLKLQQQVTLSTIWKQITHKEQNNTPQKMYVVRDPDVFMPGQKPNNLEHESSNIEGDTTVMDKSLDVSTTKAKDEMENDPQSNIRTEVEGTAILDHGYSNYARKELKSMKKQTLQTLGKN